MGEELICEHCGKASSGQRPNPGQEQAGYVWYFDNEEATEKLLDDENIPYGEYHVACHEVVREGMSLADKRANFEDCLLHKR